MTRHPVVVLGAGLTGLTLAVALQRAGQPVLVLERAVRAGGVLRSVRRDGFLAEDSANSVMLKAPEVEAFIDGLGLRDRLVEANPVATRRYLMRDGRVLPMPMSLRAAVTTPLYSTRAKLRLLREPFVKAAPEGTEESVAGFVTRRMGREFLDYGIAALVSGIFAGDPERLSVRYAFPKVWNLEATYGSLIGGAVRLMRERRRAGVTPYRSRIISFRDGLQTLPDSMAAELGSDLKLGAVVDALEPAEEGWRVAWTDAHGSQETRARALVPTVPTEALKALPWSDGPAAGFARLPSPPHPAVTTLSLGFGRDQVSHPLDGFGLLAPLVETRRILGAIFSSTLFPGRAPDGHVLFMVFMGGATRPEMAARTEAEAVGIARAELGEMFGVTGDPVFVNFRHWPRAIPQYDVGHGEFLASLEALEARWPGLHVQGNFRGGPGVNDCIAAALALAERLAPGP